MKSISEHTVTMAANKALECIVQPTHNNLGNVFNMIRYVKVYTPKISKINIRGKVYAHARFK